MNKIAIVFIFLCAINANKIIGQSNNLTKSDSVKIALYFEKVNLFMDQDNYDSTQASLDKIEQLLPIKYTTYFTYLYHSRQTEIYYYNNLLELGINQINEGLKVAKSLKDSTLIGDSYNFLGLFYLNLKQLNKAENNLLKSKTYIKGKSKIADIYNLSQIYHIYGNLAEVYLYQNRLKEAIAAIDSSIYFAKNAEKNRAVYLGIYKKGDINYTLGNYKLAYQLISKAHFLCENSLDKVNVRDVNLVTFSAMAKCMDKLGNKVESYNLLKKGFDYFDKQSDINRYYSLVFINEALAIYTLHHDYLNMYNAIKIKMQLENENLKGGLKKLETTINASLRNERRIMGYQIDEAKFLQEKEKLANRNYSIIIVLTICLLGLILFYNQHLRNTNIKLKNKNAEISEALIKGQTTERHRVAIDLHDNLGSTLSSIGFSMEAIDKSKMNDEEKGIYKNLQEMVDKAYNDVRLLSHNLLPEEFEKLGLAETLASLVRKMNKNTKIKFELEVAENFGRVDKKVEFELYSICLELVNNIIKHSRATQAKITLKNISLEAGGPIKLAVADNGIGIFKNDSDGHGMKNVQARVDAIGGRWTVEATEGKGVVNEIIV